MANFHQRYFRPYESSSLRIRRFIRSKLGLTPKVGWLFKRIAKLEQGERVLDVGCGTGGFLELIEKENPTIDTYGVDLGEPPDFLSKGKLVRGSGTKLPFPDNSFGAVVCAHVIEHLNDPGPCVRELYRVCKPGGYVYIETLSPRSAWIPFFNIFWDDPTHIRPYSQASLRRLLEISGCDYICSGVKHSVPAVLFGLPYLPIGMLTGDRQAKAMFAIYAFGFSVWTGGKKN